MIAEPKISRKQRIENKATELFQNKGYAATSMRDLAQQLGIEPASLYSHIRSKEELLQKICFSTAGQFFKSLESALSQDLNTTEKLQAAIKSHLSVIIDNPASSVVFNNEWRHLSEPHLTHFLDMRNRYENHFRNIIRQGVVEGVFSNIDEKFAVLTVLSSINWVQQWYKEDGSMSPADIGNSLSKILLDGLKNHKS